MKNYIFKGLTHPLVRRYTSDAKLLKIAVNNETGIATVSMNKSPANSLNQDFIDELTHELRTLERNKCRGIVLTSELPSIFSAGVDFKELHKPELKRIRNMWHSLQEFWLTLYGSKLPTAAAINSTSVGAGCVLAISCDYRVSVRGNYRIGLNETMLGFIAPKWTQDLLIGIVGHRRAEISLMQSCLYKPEEALKIGLVDELATDKADAIAKCEKYIASYDNIYPEARYAAKMQARQATMSWLTENRELDTNAFVDCLKKPQVQMNLDFYINSLKRK